MIDNGMGMSQEVKEHLFEPFFSTKGDRHGSGLGLATCYGIVGQSGGHITVESELAKGTALYIYLPEVAAPPAAAYRKRPKLPSGTGTILVVEDDISVRHVTVRTLRMLGDIASRRPAPTTPSVTLRIPRSILSLVTSCSLKKRVRP